MNKKDGLKLIGTIILLGISFYGPIFISLWLIPTFIGITVGLMVGIGLSVYIMGWCVPIWFKEYIKEYYSKNENKNM